MTAQPLVPLTGALYAAAALAVAEPLTPPMLGGVGQQPISVNADGGNLLSLLLPFGAIPPASGGGLTDIQPTLPSAVPSVPVGSLPPTDPFELMLALSAAHPELSFTFGGTTAPLITISAAAAPVPPPGSAPTGGTPTIGALIAGGYPGVLQGGTVEPVGQPQPALAQPPAVVPPGAPGVPPMMNPPPLIDPVAVADSYTVSHGHRLSLDAANGLLSNDSDPLGRTMTALSGVQHRIEGGLLFLQPDGSLVFSPDGEFVGTTSFQYRAEVETNGFKHGSEFVTVTIKITNDAPIVPVVTGTVHQGTMLSVGSGPGGLLNEAFDIDGDQVSLTLDQTAQQLPTREGGTVVMFNGGSYNYTPPKGFTGLDRFNFEVTDALGAKTVGLALITVTNTDPTASGHRFQVRHGEELFGTEGALLVGAIDPDNDMLHVVAHEKATDKGGTIAIDGKGGFVYTPPAFFSGTDSFTYAISDGAGLGLGAVAIDVINRAPDARNDAYGVDHGKTLQVGILNGLLSNDGAWRDGAFRDADGDTLKVMTIGLPRATAHGTVTIAEDGSFSYTPDAGFAGLDWFDYTASDGFGGTSEAVVTVRVGNNAPVAGSFGIGMTPGHFRIDVDATLGARRHVSDPDGDAVSIVAFRDRPTAEGGTATMNADGSFSYTPRAGFTGTTDSFTYAVTDNLLGGTAEGTIAIRIAHDAPATFPLPPAMTPPSLPGGHPTTNEELTGGSTGGTSGGSGGTGLPVGAPVGGVPATGDTGSDAEAPPTATAGGSTPPSGGVDGGNDAIGGYVGGAPTAGGAIGGSFDLPARHGEGGVIIIISGRDQGTDDDPPTHVVTPDERELPIMPAAEPSDELIASPVADALFAVPRFDSPADFLFA